MERQRWTSGINIEEENINMTTVVTTTPSSLWSEFIYDEYNISLLMIAGGLFYHKYEQDCKEQFSLVIGFTKIITIFNSKYSKISHYKLYIE